MKVLITGGSRGIGEACVCAFSQRGDSVAFLYRSQHERAKALADRELLLQGVIDCIIIDESGDITLVDYKTDRLPREALSDKAKAKAFLIERHALQLSYYAISCSPM